MRLKSLFNLGRLYVNDMYVFLSAPFLIYIFVIKNNRGHTNN